MKFFRFVVLLTFISSSNSLQLCAQHLSVSASVNLLPVARSDRALAISNFKGGYFVCWKAPGNAGIIHASYLGRKYATNAQQADITIPAAQSNFAPCLAATNQRLYIFWIDTSGDLKYVLSNSDTTFDTGNIHSLKFNNDNKLRYGIKAAVIGNQIIIASHADSKYELAVALLDADNNGVILPASLETVPGVKSEQHPHLVSVNNNSIRLGYSSNTGISYVDLGLDTKKWTAPATIANSKSSVSPTIYHAFNLTRIIYFASGKKDKSVYYYTENQPGGQPIGNLLSEDIKTLHPVSVCGIDNKKFVIGFTGDDQKLYLCYATSYNPASWMEETLFPAKASLTLKDVVIPGAHDAGMSVLTATGGVHQEAINACNTLTQQHNIGQQLKQGIRMFDLRIGTYKGRLYTKHSSADCMADAMGGAYGEAFTDILDSLKTFLDKHNKEIVILTFSHFCPTEASDKNVADTIIQKLGSRYMYRNTAKNIGDIKLKDLAGKVIVTFEGFASNDKLIDSNAIAPKSATFLNFRRAYAATNQLDKLLTKEQHFFISLKNNLNQNDLVRLDWQLTQSSEEATLVCNDFQSETIHPLLNGMMLLANVVAGNKSIRNLARYGNHQLLPKLNNWIANGTVDKYNKPNILYVDVAGSWITDYCVELNSEPIYN